MIEPHPFCFSKMPSRNMFIYLWLLAVVVSVDCQVIDTQPSDQLDIMIDEDATFSVTATGDSLTYQWQKDGIDITDTADTYSGTTTATLTVLSVEVANEGSYSCVVNGTVNSTSAQLTVAVDPQLVVDCGSLPGPTNGAVSTSSGTNENDTAIYSCETGYNLNGEIIRTCEDDGQWAPDEPTCDLIPLTPGSGSGDMILPSLEPTTSIPPSSTTMNTPNVVDPTTTIPAEPTESQPSTTSSTTDSVSTTAPDIITPTTTIPLASTSLNPPEPSSTPEPTTLGPTTPSPLEPLTTVSPADPPVIVFTFIGLSLEEFNSTVMDLLLSVVENITDIEANITVMATMVPNENITTVTLFFESTGEVDDITIAMEVQTALEDTDNPAWITLQQQYAVMFELVVVTTPTALSTTSQTPPLTIALTIWQWIIVTVAATSLLLASLLTIFCCCRCLVLRKRRKPAKGYKRHLLTERELPYHHSPKSGVEMNGVHVQPRKVARITFRPKGLLQQLSHPLSVEELEALVNNTAALYGEYSSIPSNMVTIAEVPPGAEDKNRYRDVLPNPYTRVSLFLKFGVANSDYINASYIRGYKDSSKSYIATQGPLQWTVGDFWRMVWEQRSSTIIMVTGLEERGSTKCSRYWPDVAINHSTSYEDLEVRLKRRLSASNNEFVTTTFHLAHKQKMVSREVTHYWFTGWPDHGVPSTAKPIIEFLLQARGSIRDMPGPTVVHCSAGIGRTGVFIGADIGMQQLEDEGQVDILKTVATLRQDRGGMVQTKDQYVFLHKVLLEYAHYLAQVRNTYRSGYKGQGSYLHPTIEEDPTDRSVLLT